MLRFEVARNIQNAVLAFLLFAAATGLISANSSGVTRLIASLTTVGLILGGVIAGLPPFLERVKAYYRAKSDFHELDLDQRRDDLICELKKLTKPLVIIIDDIDRLNNEEIRLVIQLVKANTNLPNVIFFLLFQKDIVVKALEDISHQRGSDYLEKIIQIGFDVPPVPEGKLQKILIDELNNIFSGIDLGQPLNEDRWNSVFNGYLKFYFRTLRDVYRYASTLRFHASFLNNKNVLEVNQIDLISIEALRVFDHPVYERIRDSFEIYINPMSRTLYHKEQKQERINIVLDEIVEPVEPARRERVKELLGNLFPQISPRFSDQGETWDRDLRVCHEKHFSKYFELTLRDNTVSELELSLILKSANDSTLVSKILIEYSNRALLPELFDRLEQNTEKISVDAIGPFLQGVLRVSDELSHIPPAGIFDFPPVVRMARLARALLLRTVEKSRVSLLGELFSTSEALRVPAMLLDAEEHKPNDDPQKRYLLKEGELEAVRPMFFENIKKAAADGRLIKADQCLWLLQCWKRWSGTDEASDWAKNYIRDGNSAMRLIMAAVSVSTVSDHRGTRHVDTLPLKWLEQFIDLEQAWRLVSTLDKNALDERHNRIIRLFERGLENKRQGRSYDQIQDHN